MQGGDRLTAGRFLVNVADDTQAVYRAQAVDDVNLWMGGGALVQGLAPSSAGRGPRHLAGKKLDLWFRPDRTLQEATAGPDAVLTIRPGKGDPPEKRILKARFLAFAFDERGKMSELRGQKDSSFVAEPLPPAKASARTLTCQSFIARVDPATGEPALIEFTKDVVFVEGTQRATAEKAYFDGPKSALFLQEGPALTDTAQGSKLTAKVIQIATRSGDLEAHDDVRHVIDKPGTEGGLLGGKGGSTLMAADRFEYAAGTKLARYRQSALLRTGKDEIRADEIRIHELAGGKRRLEAVGIRRLAHAAGGGEGRGQAAGAGRGPGQGDDLRGGEERDRLHRRRGRSARATSRPRARRRPSSSPPAATPSTPWSPGSRWRSSRASAVRRGPARPTLRGRRRCCWWGRRSC